MEEVDRDNVETYDDDLIRENEKSFYDLQDLMRVGNHKNARVKLFKPRALFEQIIAK